MFDLPFQKYSVILADPPWQFQTWSEKGRDRCPDNKHYQTMSIVDIVNLKNNVRLISTKDCALFMWSTWPMLNQALHVMLQWGFIYKTCAFCWMKGYSNDDLWKGNGYWTRANTEFCLLGTRGKPKRKSRDVPQAILEPRREHSRKPDITYEYIERLLSGPYVELFARQRRIGWDAWGNEIDKFSRKNPAGVMRQGLESRDPTPLG